MSSFAPTRHGGNVRTKHDTFVATIRVGGGITPAALPHHRTYGSVYGGSRLLARPAQRASFRSSCRLSSNRRRGHHQGFRPLRVVTVGPQLTPRLPSCTRREHARLSTHDKFSPSPLRLQATTTASADFCQPIPTPHDVGSTRQIGRSPRVKRVTFMLMPVGF